MGTVPVAIAFTTTYVILAPTHDIRARLPHITLDPVLIVGVLVVLFGTALVVVTLTGPVTRRSVAGAGVSAAFGTGLLEVGAFSAFIPDIHTRWLGWTVWGIVLLGAVVAVFAERRKTDTHAVE